MDVEVIWYLELEKRNLDPISRGECAKIGIMWLITLFGELAMVFLQIVGKMFGFILWVS